MLGQKFQTGTGSKVNYINFRDSKLTRILQQALSGNSMTSIICTMSQLFNNYSESRETLNFGAKAKNIKTIVNLNEIIKESPEEIAHKLQKYSRENEDLRLKVLGLESALETLRGQMELDSEEYGNLGNMKAHQDYLMQLIEGKNMELQAKSER